MRSLLVSFLLPLTINAQNLFPIGSWREHLPYTSVIDVTSSANKIYAATPYSLFSVDIISKETERITKISGLSETGISTIKFDAISNQLLVAYTNSNIDVIDAKGINNIPDLKRENISGDKSINHIYPANDISYLSTGIGIVVLNTTKYEIRDFWLIGRTGGYVKTNMFTKDGSFFYAATDEGLKRTSTITANPADFTNWQTLSGSNGLSASACKGIINVADKIIALQNDSLFLYSGNGWNLFFTNGQPIVSINTTENKITLCQKWNSGSRVIILNADGSIAETISQAGIISSPQNAIIHNGAGWIADEVHALSHWKGSLIDNYQLNAPQGIATGEIIVYNKKFYGTAGSVNDAWEAQKNEEGIYKLEEGNWTNYNHFTTSQLDSLKNFITIVIDPRDETIWAGSFGGGLLHLNNYQFVIYKQNSPIQSAINNSGNYNVSGLAFDTNNNLWVANFGAAQYLHVLKNDNSWQSFAAPFVLSENAVSQIIIDDYDQKWIVSPKNNGLLVFNHGASFENTADDKWKIYQPGQGAGNLPSNNVLSILKDKSGFIWVGTADGIGIIQCPQDATTIGCEAILPVAENSGFASYLFKGEEVRSIAVDGADRKWIATKNGVWLISADGEKVIERFTEDNSFLLSNDVKRITVDGNNGEIFFATAKGICSFKGTATEGSVTDQNLLVYPNPVPPDYTGKIAIKGLAQNSFVKITELNGRLVYQTKSLGGQAIWNGRDYKGKQISSGVYLVLVTDEGRQERAAGKIVFIAR